MEKLLCGRHYMNTSIKLTLQLYDRLLFQFIDVDTEGQSGTGHGTSKWWSQESVLLTLTKLDICRQPSFTMPLHPHTIFQLQVTSKGALSCLWALLMLFFCLGTPSPPFRKPPAMSGLSQLELFICLLSMSFLKCELHKCRQAFCLVHWGDVSN